MGTQQDLQRVLAASSSSQHRDFASRPLRKATSPGSLSERSAPARRVTAGCTKQPGREGALSRAQEGQDGAKALPTSWGRTVCSHQQRRVCFWLLPRGTGGGSLPPSGTSPGSHQPSQQAPSLSPLPVIRTLQAPASALAGLQPCVRREGPSSLLCSSAASSLCSAVGPFGPCGRWVPR